MALALEHPAIHRHPFPRAHPYPITGHQQGHRQLSLLPIAHSQCLTGTQIQQLSQRSGGIAPGTGFQRLAKQDETDDHHRGFKIEMLRLRRYPLGGPGQYTQQQRGVKPGGAGSQRDQGIHVEMGMGQPLPGPAENVSGAVTENPQGHQGGNQAHDQARSRAGFRQRTGQHQQHQQGAHPQGHQGARQGGAELLRLLAVPRFRIRFVEQLGTKAGVLDQSNDAIRRQLALHRGAAFGKIDGVLFDALGPTERLFDTAHTAGATHILQCILMDGHDLLLCWHMPGRSGPISAWSKDKP